MPPNPSNTRKRTLPSGGIPGRAPPPQPLPSATRSFSPVASIQCQQCGITFATTTQRDTHTRVTHQLNVIAVNSKGGTSTSMLIVVSLTFTRKAYDVSGVEKSGFRCYCGTMEDQPKALKNHVKKCTKAAAVMG